MDSHLNELFTRTRLGEFLHRRDLIDDDKLNAALAAQQASGLKLGEILSDGGHIDRAELDHLLEQQSSIRNLGEKATRDWIQQQTRLGALLAQLDLVGPDQLQEALSHQQQSRRALGEILVDQGHLSLQKLHDVLHLQDKLRQALLMALVGLLSAALIAPSLSFADASVASTQISITLRFVKPPPVVQVSEMPGSAPVLSLDGVTLSPDAAGQYDLSPLEDLPAGAPSQSVDFHFEPVDNLPMHQGTMTLYVNPR